MGGKRIGPDILAYLADRANKPVALQRMAADLKLEERQVQQAIVTLRQGQYADAIEVIQRGQVWRYTAPVAAEPARVNGLTVGDMVEVIGTTESGDVVSRDDAGKLYRVSPL